MLSKNNTAAAYPRFCPIFKNDAELLEAIQQEGLKRECAYFFIFQNWKESSAQLLKSKCQASQTDAEEAFADALISFEKTVSKPDFLLKSALLKTYFMRCVFLRFVFLKAKKSRPKIPFFEIMPALVEQKIAETERQIALLDLLKTLPLREREVVWAFANDEPPAETVQKWRFENLTQLRKTRFRAIQKIRADLEQNPSLRQFLKKQLQND